MLGREGGSVEWGVGTGKDYGAALRRWREAGYTPHRHMCTHMCTRIQQDAFSWSRGKGNWIWLWHDFSISNFIWVEPPFLGRRGAGNAWGIKEPNMQREDLIKLCSINLEHPGWMKLQWKDTFFLLKLLGSWRTK